MSEKQSGGAEEEKPNVRPAVIETPSRADGAAFWRIARDSQKLDLNSSYAYLLWCHDFADTSVVAKVDGVAVGFVMGYRRPSAPDTAVVWQVAVDSTQRGRGLAATLLDALFERLTSAGIRYLETTITPDNEASIRLFRSFAKRWNASLDSTMLFAATDFPDEHEPENLYRIGPLGGAA
ncbi:L-2,4-diaminobutyric acid acetyltransferase [Tamaricihabitans halophyticus]|uniref:L-2,4-diaminobutyric acid acetyltransferase n=1 Tax=Tamaricihabitans halophyticus TaxID=1262583 RepID=A0A4R2R4E4_9PSEU|nr:diaminobutyrate acetyltransferase [Tamaricihabitans halophyticus]TCP56629.1 L-2,4-diaminobutyric acid acetyltransferase [Tamaricihabitans halophyticus]